MSMSVAKGKIASVAFQNTDLVKSFSQVKGTKHFGIFQPSQSVMNVWEGEILLNRDLIQPPEVCTVSPPTTFLFYKNDGGAIRTL